MKEGEVKEVLNYILNKTAEMICANLSTNSRYAVWLAALPTNPMPADAAILNPDDAPLTLKAARQGDLQQKPFVMVKNLSDVYACTYKITFVGLKKPIKGAVVTTEEDMLEVIKPAV